MRIPLLALTASLSNCWIPSAIAFTGSSFVASIPSIRQSTSAPFRPVSTRRLDSFTAPTTDASASSLPVEEPMEHYEAVVCGGGPAGLLSAIMLAEKGRTVQLYDRLSEPPGPDDETVWGDVAKFYLIGLGGRGQGALKHFGVWEDVEKRSVAVLGRKDWAPDAEEGVERIFTKRDKRVTTQVLPRDKLVGVMHQYILEHYPDRIQLNYGYEVHPVDFEYQGGSQVLIEVAKCSEDVARLNPSSVKVASEEQPEVLCDTDAAKKVSTDFLVAADGTVRTIANAMERQDRERLKAMKNPIRRLWEGARTFHVQRYVDDNQRIYKTIPMKIPSDWRPDLNYSARTKEGRVNYDALPANNKGDYCGVLLLKKGDPLAQANTDPKELRKLLDEALPQFSALLDDETVAQVAHKPVSYLPGFRYAGPRLNQGDRCLILGDCAHTVKPYFGLGANSALEDVRILSDIMDESDSLSEAVHEFSRRQAPEAKALVRISRDLDRPGKVGFFTFILPLILDSIFSGLAPKLFQPNIIAMLQREQFSFQQVARRKRLDRIVQVSIIAGGLTGVAVGTKCLIQALAKAVGRSNTTVVAGIGASVASISLLKRLLAKYMVPGLAPADVLTRLSNKVTNSRTHLTPLRMLFRNKDKDGGESTANAETWLAPKLGFKNTSDKDNTGTSA